MTPERWGVVRAAIERARKSSFYARSLATARIEEPEDFAKLPVTRKQDVASAGAFDLLAVPPAHAWHYHESSGTTGQPVSTWCGLDELGRWRRSSPHRCRSWRHDAMLLNRFPSFAPIPFVIEEVLRRTARVTSRPAP